uniref:uncharacterized protein LOC122583892 n=1 Tax=Erigeron canadensis TaxID=72917 RepID=UPI001CB8C181|nr:uncharacterized protein LOC122583892 [Erigeron canadensis]
MSGTKTLKLYCPSLSKAVQLVARDDQKLDLGAIARTFGLDPNTLKLNGHFISRGVDLIANSVTWKSLISFFSSRGLSTGTSGSGALVVDGKLSKPGSKRAHNSVNRIPEDRPQLEESNLSKKTKFKDCDADRGSGVRFKSIPFRLKRKQEDEISSMKRLKLDEPDIQVREHAGSETLSKIRFRCNFLGVNMKRMREDEIDLPASCKKCR